MARASARTTNALLSGAAAPTASTVGVPACRTPLLSLDFTVASACVREPQARATAPARSSGIRRRVFIVKPEIERHRKGESGRPLTHPTGREVINKQTNVK